MASPRGIHGEIRQYQTPDWRPLEKLLRSYDLCAHFMWMHDVELNDGTIVNAYKHRWTRRYFHLSGDGRAFLYGSRELYRQVDLFSAIEEAFETWECCEPTAVERAALHSALHIAQAATS